MNIINMSIEYNLKFILPLLEIYVAVKYIIILYCEIYMVSVLRTFN